MSAISGSTGSEVSIRDVAEFVRLREVDRLKEVVASDEEDRAAIEHLFYHERYGELYESDVRIEYKSVEYVFILSESFKTRSGIQKCRTYQGYLLGVDRSQDSGFFIHLVPHDERFELQNYVWTKEEIQCFESSTGSLYAVDREVVKNSRKPSFSDDLDEMVKVEAGDSGVSVEPVDPSSVEFEDLTSINRTRGID